jgi:protein-S-isoprenylcysteine O-methyltransferase Ste14
MTAEGPFRLVQAVVFLAFILHRAYYNRRFPPTQEETVEEQTQGTVHRIANLLVLPALLGLALYVINPSWMAWSELGLSASVRWVGVLIAVAGFALLQWSHWALGRNWSDNPRITESQTLTTDGPYRWVRHPIYTSFLAILGSSLLITSNWFVGLIWLLITAIDVRNRIGFEEARLHARFGETYENYRQSTGHLLPRLK